MICDCWSAVPLARKDAHTPLMGIPALRAKTLRHAWTDISAILAKIHALNWNFGLSSQNSNTEKIGGALSIVN